MTLLWFVGGALLSLVGILALWERWGPRWVTRWRALQAERDTRDRLRRRSDELRKQREPRDPHRW